MYSLFNRCVLPNRMFIQLSDNVNAREACAMQPQGVVRICAIEARNLMKMDVREEIKTTIKNIPNCFVGFKNLNRWGFWGWVKVTLTSF